MPATYITYFTRTRPTRRLKIHSFVIAGDMVLVRRGNPGGDYYSRRFHDNPTEASIARVKAVLRGERE